jgi:hypothetical protein
VTGCHSSSNTDSETNRKKTLYFIHYGRAAARSFVIVVMTWWTDGSQTIAPPSKLWHPRSCLFMLLRTLNAFPHP